MDLYVMLLNVVVFFLAHHLPAWQKLLVVVTCSLSLIMNAYCLISSGKLYMLPTSIQLW